MSRRIRENNNLTYAGLKSYLDHLTFSIGSKNAANFSTLLNVDYICKTNMINIDPVRDLPEFLKNWEPKEYATFINNHISGAIFYGNENYEKAFEYQKDAANIFRLLISDRDDVFWQLPAFQVIHSNFKKTCNCLKGPNLMDRITKATDTIIHSLKSVANEKRPFDATSKKKFCIIFYKFTLKILLQDTQSTFTANWNYNFCSSFISRFKIFSIITKSYLQILSWEISII